jgi:LruC domain-containing protein
LLFHIKTFIFAETQLAMSKNFWILYVALVALSVLSCKKNDIDSTAVKEIKDLKISPDFNWETSRDITFDIHSDISTGITITSETSTEQYYQGFFNGLNEKFSVKLAIPALIKQLRVNGTLVSISGSVVPVYLPKSYKKAEAFHPSDIPIQGMIAAWHFNENTGTIATDSAFGHNGLINSAIWTNGIRGSALEFNGNTSQVQVPNSGLNPVGNSISFSFWFKLNTVGGIGTFIFQEQKYMVSLDALGRIIFTIYTPSAKSANSGVSSRILDTDWHHVALTYDGLEMKIFLDGLQRVYNPNSGNLQSSTSNVYIGKQPTVNSFDGNIDEFLIYDRAISNSEVLQIFGSTPAPNAGDDNLVSHWKFDENAGTIANDSKGSNVGTISAASWGTGISGSCLKFDGITSAVKAPSKINLNPVFAITLMAWAKTESNTTTKILQKGDWDGHGIGQGNWDGWGGQIRLEDNTTQGLSWGNGLPVLNEWYHLAMTYDGQQLKYYVNGQLKNSKAVTGLLHVNARDLSIGSDDGVQKFFKGSIDEPKFFNRALDQTEIQSNYSQPGNAPDKDGDGISDMLDSYPNDPARAFINYSPATGFGTLAFEDLWPSTGDYDFNDLVLDYRFKTITNASNKVSEVYATFVLRAIGAGMKNGFGFQLPGSGIAATDIEVTGFKLKEGIINLSPNGTESGQQKNTIIVFDNAYKIMPFSGGFGVNVQPGATFVQPDTTVISLCFKPNTYSIEDVGIANFNPFLIVNLDRGREIHLPDHPPTSLANPAFFATGNDNSTPATGRYYKTATNLPWAIRISSGYDYTIEGAQITAACLKFGAWAESSGLQFPDWYMDISGYRNVSYIYPASK